MEAILLGLRTDVGVPRARLSRWPHPEAARAVGRRWLAESGENLRATPEGWLRLDELAAVLTT
jgi:coproporphyrinogen III oxidase-like Fe-S oxidoreductase